MAEYFIAAFDVAWRGWKHILHYAEGYQTLAFAIGWGLYFAKVFLAKLRKDVDILDLKNHSLRKDDPEVIDMMKWYKEQRQKKKSA